MSFLNGQLAKALYDGMKSQMLKGSLRTIRGGTTADANGDYTPTKTVYPATGFTDEYSDYFKKTSMIPQGDCKVCLFAKGLPSGVRPMKDDQVLFRGQWYQVRDCKTDPAIALWECQAFEIPTPADL